jgi:putative Holliday junction resolvase
MSFGNRSMGLDVGERRIGVAIADELGMIASPHSVVERRDGDLRQLHDLAQVNRVARIVIGLPVGMSGREGPQAATVREFAARLEKEIDPGIEIAFWDERLTTAVAERALRDRPARDRRTKGTVDAIAASVILQGYLDAKKTTLRQW